MSLTRSFFRFLMAFFLTVFSIAVIGCIISMYFIATPSGGKFLVNHLLKTYGEVASVSVGSYEGSILQGFVLKDIKLTRLPRFPEAVTRIQQAKVQVPFAIWDWHNFSVQVLNGRIFLPQSDPIVFNGSVVAEHLEVNLFAKSIDVGQLAQSFMSEEDRKYLIGFVTNVDLIIKGPLAHPRVTGHLFVDRIKFKSTVVSDGFGHLDVTVSQWGPGRPQIKGEAALDAGLILARHVNLDLLKSRVDFIDDAYNPSLDIHATTKVEDIQIDFTLKGTFHKPELVFSSDPPLAQDVLLLVLATGKSRNSGVGVSSLGGDISGEIVGDFMNYLMLGGNSDDFTRQYDAAEADERKKVGLRRSLTNDLKVGIGLEQVANQPGRANQNTYYAQTVEGEMAVSDGLSLNVAQKVTPNQREETTLHDPQSTTQNSETQIYLKYKRNF